MLWYKSWLETRWRFLIGTALLLCSAASCVFTYPHAVKLLPLAPTTNVDGELGRRIREAVELARTYGGFVWSQWFRQNLPQLATLFAVLLGTASLLSSSRGALFTLSLPFSRNRLLGTRAAVGLAELFVLAFVPSLLIPLLSPAIGQSFGLGTVLIHSACLFIGVSVFYSLAFLLSTIFLDPWRPMLIALALAFGLAILDQLLQLPAISVFRVMSAETYFRRGEVPWGGLVASGVIAAALYAGAVANVARRDF